MGGGNGEGLKATAVQQPQAKQAATAERNYTQATRQQSCQCRCRRCWLAKNLHAPHIRGVDLESLFWGGG